MSKSQGNSVSDNREPYVPQAVADDEIDLIDYLLVLLKHKRFILLFSFLPPLVVGLALFWAPRHYTVSYTYRMAMGVTELKILEDKFYSAENIEKLIDELQEHGLEKHVRALTAAQTREDLKRLAAFEVLPPLFDTKPRTFGELQERIDAKSELLVMHIQNSSPKNLRETGLIIRNNFEQIIPLYSENDRLTRRIIGLKNDMMQIEETRYALTLRLQRKTSTLEKLETSAPEAADKLASDVVLQFDIGTGDSAYLPLPYQIQAARTQLINLDEQIRTNSELYAYYSEQLAMYEMLLTHLNGVSGSRFTLEQFHAFLTDTLAGFSAQPPHLRDQLSAYIKRIENERAGAVPVIENPTVYAAAKGTLKITAIVFAVAFILSIFGAFLSEGLQRKKYQPVQLN